MNVIIMKMLDTVLKRLNAFILQELLPDDRIVLKEVYVSVTV